MGSQAKAALSTAHQAILWFLRSFQGSAVPHVASRVCQSAHLS